MTLSQSNDHSKCQFEYLKPIFCANSLALRHCTELCFFCCSITSLFFIWVFKGDGKTGRKLEKLIDDFVKEKKRKQSKWCKFFFHLSLSKHFIFRAVIEWIIKLVYLTINILRAIPSRPTLCPLMIRQWGEPSTLFFHLLELVIVMQPCQYYKPKNWHIHQPLGRTITAHYKFSCPGARLAFLPCSQSKYISAGQSLNWNHLSHQFAKATTQYPINKSLTKKE